MTPFVSSARTSQELTRPKFRAWSHQSTRVRLVGEELHEAAATIVEHHHKVPVALVVHHETGIAAGPLKWAYKQRPASLVQQSLSLWQCGTGLGPRLFGSDDPRSVCADAEEQAGLRGEIFKGKDIQRRPSADHTENREGTSYTGNHLIRALLVRDRTVVAVSAWFRVNIYSRGRGFRL